LTVFSFHGKAIRESIFMQNKNLVWIIVAGVIVLGLAYFLGNRADMATPAPATPAEAPASSDATPANDPNSNISATGAARGAEFPGGVGDRGQ